MILRECKLYDPVKLLFESMGYSVYAEIPILFSCVDIGALKDNIIVAIEMKMSLTKKVIDQAYTHNIFADYTYIVVPTNPRSTEECIKRSIGIIQVKNDKASIIVKAKKINKFYANYRKIFIKRCLQSNIEIAGLPVLKGQGPRIECRKRIKEYLKINPKATWKQIYNNIPNHYSNYKSMACAVGSK